MYALSSTPIAPGERIDTLDAIRDFALLGIFIMNMLGNSVEHVLRRVPCRDHDLLLSLIVRGLQNERWRRRMAPVTLAGRMPLTNYLLQTMIATFLFFGWGLGLWGSARQHSQARVVGSRRAGAR